MALNSPRFSGDPVLEACSNGTRVLKAGDVGLGVPAAVQKVQQALSDLNLLQSQFGIDGKFGNDTKAAVVKFQQANGLKPDGIIGPNTIDKLDATMGKQPGLPPAPAPPSIPIPTLDKGVHWGVDTSGPLDFACKNRRGQLSTIFDVVTEEMGMPEFWGRYLFQTANVTGLDKREIKFVKERSGGKCKILLIANFGPSQFVQGFNTGLSNANVSAGKAKALGAPAGVWIYADIESNFKCNPNWFQGWWKGMEDAGRGRGGLYVDPAQTGSAFDRATGADSFMISYRKALQADSKNVLGDSTVFPPDLPSKARLLWSIRKNFLNKVVDLRDKFTKFEPVGVDFHKGMTALWQYAGDCFLLDKSNSHKIDMNLANDQGFASLWTP